MKAVARPWRAETIYSYTNGEPVEVAIRSEDYEIALVDIEGEDIDQQFANAEFIVDAANTHDDLQATISRLTAALQEAIDVFAGMSDDEIDEELLPRLREALATPAVSDADAGGAR